MIQIVANQNQKKMSKGIFMLERTWMMWSEVPLGWKCGKIGLQ